MQLDDVPEPSTVLPPADELAAAAMAAAADEVWFDAAEDWAADNPEQQNADVTAEAMAIYQDLIQAEYTAPELRKIFGVSEDNKVGRLCCTTVLLQLHTSSCSKFCTRTPPRLPALLTFIVV